MYLREIGQVDLLTVDDERRLAQLIEEGAAAAQQIDEAAEARRPSSTAVESRMLTRADQPRRASEERADAGQPAPRRQHRQALLGPGDAAARPDPGGQPRPDAGGRQVRLHEGLQVLDLRHLVDPPGDHPLDRRPGAHDPHPGAHGRAHEPRHASEASDAPGAGARADGRRARRSGCSSNPTACASCCATAQDPLSLDSPVGEEDESNLGDFIEDDTADSPADAATKAMLVRRGRRGARRAVRARARDRAAALRARQAARLKTLEEVGKEFGVTRERIRQIEAKTLAKLRHPQRSQRLREFLEVE